MLTILLIILVIMLLIELRYQRSLVKHYRQKYSNELYEHNQTADELHHLKVKYNIIPITSWDCEE